MGYTHTNSKGKTYHLHSKDVTLKGGRNQTIYYFAKDARSNACDLPAGKQVVESPKTGLPFVKGKQFLLKNRKDPSIRWVFFCLFFENLIKFFQ